MNLAGKNFLTLDDLSNQEIEAIFGLASEMEKNLNGYLELCRGKVLASLFFEPSTRTRLSFETAMHRLGGSVITATEFDTTSLAKGESLADMARVIGSYADIIVIRHPWEGAARAVAEYAGVPVINGGDGSHEHPTQTLCDLYTLKQERSQITGLKIILSGDLKRGRTVHSLAYGLARFGARAMVFWPAPGLEMPNYVINKLVYEYGGSYGKIPASDLHSLVNGDTNGTFDAIYMTPTSPHELALIPQMGVEIHIKGDYDSIYITRLQRERASEGKTEAPDNRKYPVIDSKLLKKPKLKRTLIMHPLPRLDEVARDLDADPRSMYFKQAARGIPVRMALISLLLGVTDVDNLVDIKMGDHIVHKKIEIYDKATGIICKNENCVTNKQSEHVVRRFQIVPRMELSLRCIYCDYEVTPQYVCDLKHKTCHPCSSYSYKRIPSKYRVFLNSSSEAQAQGFSLSIPR